MQKINKSLAKILSTNYIKWLDKLEKEGKKHPESSSYYDDVVMNLYLCQAGVCAYTEKALCPPEFYADKNWITGKYTFPKDTGKRNGHSGELDHFDPTDKDSKFWNWDNLFMIDAKVNGNKSNAPVVPYLKPDLEDYAPEKYFDYDEKENLFIPNTDIEDEVQIKEIQRMIDDVLYLNHGMIKNDRRDYINNLRMKKTNCC